VAILNVREISDALDRFYAVPENGPISIGNALTIIAQRASGKSEAEIEHSTAVLRAKETK